MRRFLFMKASWCPKAIVLVVFLGVFLCLGSPFVEPASAERETSDINGAAVAGVTGLDDLLQKLTCLMLKSHPVLISQRKLVEESRALPVPKGGLEATVSLSADLGADVEGDQIKPVPLVGVRVSIPLLSPGKQGKIAQERLERRRTIETDVQQLEELEEDLTTSLMEKVGNIIEVQNKRQGQSRLKKILVERRHQLQKLVEVGVAEPVTLWDLDERIANLEAELANLETRQLLLMNETARNFGGASWQEMRELLERISKRILQSQSESNPGESGY